MNRTPDSGAIPDEGDAPAEGSSAADARLRFLSHASEVLGSSLDYGVTLAALAELSIERIADWCIVEIVADGHRRASRTVTHRDPAKIRWAAEITERYPPDPDRQMGQPHVLRTGRSEFYPEIPDEMLVRSAVDEDHLGILREVGFTGVVIVPIVGTGAIIGTISFITAGSDRRLGAADLALAEELGRRAGTAIENAELLAEARRAAERARRLQEFASALNEAVSVAEVAETSVVHGIPALGAAAGSLAVLDPPGEHFEILHSRGFPAEVEERWRRFALQRGQPVSDAVLRREALILANREEYEARYPDLSAELASARTAALIAIPLVSRGVPLGCLTFAFGEPQHFDPGVITFEATLGEQASQALARARMYEAERELRAATEVAVIREREALERVRVLAAAGEALASAREVDATLDALSRLLVPQVADWCFVERPGGERFLTPIALHHADAELRELARRTMLRYPTRAANTYGSAAVLRSGRSEFVPELPESFIDAVAHNAEHRQLYDRVGFRSLLSVPLLSGGDVLGVLTVVMAESGRTFTREDVPFFEELGRRAGVAVENADLYTRATTARAEAERNAALLTAVLDAGADPIFAKDEGGRMIAANQAALRVFDRPLHEVIGRTDADLFPRDYADRLAELDRRVMATGEVITEEELVPVAGGLRIFSSAKGPLRDVEGRVIGVVGVSRDITAEHDARAERDRLFAAERAARADAEEANRAKTEFLSAMSHELRTPLNAIAGFVELLELGIQGPVTEGQAAYLERIRRAELHLLALISDILNFARIEAGRIEVRAEPVALRAVANEVAPLVDRQLAEKELGYLVTESDVDVVAIGDPDRIQQILLNLIGNAVKFTDPGGSVRLEMGVESDRVVVSVVDTGVGIPADRVAEAFDPFVQFDRHRTTGTQQGVGLGLAISRELARAMGGEVTARSEVGVGSTFTLTLPRSPDPAPAA